MVSISWSHSSFSAYTHYYHSYGSHRGNGTGGSPQSQNGMIYADHWSDGDPYTHNLLVHRYGIKAEQLDGF